MRERTKDLTGEKQGTDGGEVKPYFPGSSDPAAEAPWARPPTHRVAYRVISGRGCRPGVRNAAGARSHRGRRLDGVKYVS